MEAIIDYETLIRYRPFTAGYPYFSKKGRSPPVQRFSECADCGRRYPERRHNNNVPCPLQFQEPGSRTACTMHSTFGGNCLEAGRPLAVITASKSICIVDTGMIAALTPPRSKRASPSVSKRSDCCEGAGTSKISCQANLIKTGKT